MYSIYFGILNLIIIEDIIVNPPIRNMAYSIPNKSAVIPDKIAPIAYPRSLQSLKVPILSALCIGVAS